IIAQHDGAHTALRPRDDDRTEACLTQRVADVQSASATAILPRRHSCTPRDGLVRAANGAVAGGPDRAPHVITGAEMRPHRIQPTRLLILARRHAHDFLERALEMERRQTHRRAQSLERYVLVEMLIEVAHGATDATLRRRARR